MRSGSQPAPNTRSFRCEVSLQDRTAIVRAIGELDLATVQVLDEQLEALRDAEFRRLILDLRNLDFIDSAGLHRILGYHSRARQDGFSIELIKGPPAVQRIFEIAGAGAYLRFSDA
jgi:anti-anti-sigma factor